MAASIFWVNLALILLCIWMFVMDGSLSGAFLWWSGWSESLRNEVAQLMDFPSSWSCLNDAKFKDVSARASIDALHVCSAWITLLGAGSQGYFKFLLWRTVRNGKKYWEKKREEKLGQKMWQSSFLRRLLGFRLLGDNTYEKMTDG